MVMVWSGDVGNMELSCVHPYHTAKRIFFHVELQHGTLFCCFARHNFQWQRHALYRTTMIDQAGEPQLDGYAPRFFQWLAHCWQTDIIGYFDIVEADYWQIRWHRDAAVARRP